MPTGPNIVPAGGQVTGSLNGAFRRIYRSGAYSIPEVTAIASGTPTLQRQFFLPFWSDGQTTYDRIGIWLTTLAATAVVRLARYNDNGSGAPGTLVGGADDGTVDCSAGSGSQKDITINWTPPVGLFWLSGCAQVAAPAVVIASGSLGMHAVSGGQLLRNGWQVNAIAGAFSDNPAVTSVATAGYILPSLRMA